MRQNYRLLWQPEGERTKATEQQPEAEAAPQAPEAEPPAETPDTGPLAETLETLAEPPAETPEPASAADDDTWWQESDAPADGDGVAVGDNPAEGITTPLEQFIAPESIPAVPTPEPVLVSERGLAFAALRDVGRVRSINQDNVFGMVVTVPRGELTVPIGVFVVADGMGGHEGGEIASRLAVNTTARAILSRLVLPALDEALTESMQSVLTTALQEANRAIWETAQSQGTDMGTTCTAVLLIGHTVYTGHIGDSRAYLVTASGMQTLTTDHSAVGRLIQLGQITADDAREHPLRSHLYRSVGQSAEVQVDYEYTTIGGATHLLLCSDGLWSMLEEADMHAIISGAAWPQDACQELIVQANAAGGEDNISAVVVLLPA